MQTAVIDIGKPGKNLGWSFGDAEAEGCDLDECIDALASALAEGGLALGFEAPMFVPLREKPGELLKARKGESNRPFSAGAGSTVLVSALVVVTYVLSRLRTKSPQAVATFDWRSPPSDPMQVLLFEAFVTDQGKTTAERHVEDARLAVNKFKLGMKNPATLESAIAEQITLNLLGAMVLRTGWSADLGVLAQPCLVVRADRLPATASGVDNNAP